MTNYKCEHCGNENQSRFESHTELDYDDGTDEPNTSNHLVEITYIECLDCGEVQAEE